MKEFVDINNDSYLKKKFKLVIIHQFFNYRIIVNCNKNQNRLIQYNVTEKCIIVIECSNKIEKMKTLLL